MEFDAEHFQRLLKQEERAKREQQRNEQEKRRRPSVERSRDERRQKRGRRSEEREEEERRRNDRRDKDRDDKREDRKDDRRDDRRDQRRDDRSRFPREEARNDPRNDPRGGYDRRGTGRDLNQKDPYYRDRREIERVRQTDPKKAEMMENDLDKKIIIDKKQKEVEAMTEKFKEAQKELEEAKREDLTVLVYCLPLKAREDDIWKFFKKQLCGKVRDIRIIKDPRSLRSKGVAYVEFYTSQSVQKALRTDGRQFQFAGRLSALKVQHSQAEKNRAAAVAVKMRIHKQVETPEEYHESSRKQTKVLIGGLVGKLADISERELKEPFQAFGSIEKIDINRDPLTGRCKGFAFIQYSRVEDARSAVKAMNNTPLRGQTLEVSIVNVSQQNQQIESSAYYQSQNYNRSKPSGNNLMRPPIATETTSMLVIYDIFTMQGKTPAFFDGLKKEFYDKCSSYGQVENIFIERNDQGNIWVKFNSVEAVNKAKEGLEKIFFDGNRVKCYSVTETTYKSRVGK